MTGTPGSGKSHSMAFHIRNELRRGRNVISTVDIDIDRVTKKGVIVKSRYKIGVFKYVPIYELTPEVLYRFAVRHHKKGVEGQTFVFVDECQLIFNSRDYSAKNRMPWIEFFTRHRHLGYNIYLITQSDRSIDRQIRYLVEHEIKHKKVNNYLWFLPVTLFVAVETWYGNTTKVKIRSQFILFSRSVAKLYDSYTMFDEFLEKYKDELVEGCEEQAKDRTVSESGERIRADTIVGVGGPHDRGGPGRSRFRNFFKSFFVKHILNSRIKY